MKKLNSLLLTGCLMATGPVAASVIVLDFEGAGNGAQLLNYYNGGTDSLGNSGTNYGIAFGSNALSLVDVDYVIINGDYNRDVWRDAIKDVQPQLSLVVDKPGYLSICCRNPT